MIVMIVDENNTLIDSTVIVDKDGLGMHARKISTGIYSFIVAAGNYTVSANKLGYETILENVMIEELSPLQLNISIPEVSAGYSVPVEYNVHNIGNAKYYGVQVKVEIPRLKARAVSAMPFSLLPDQSSSGSLNLLIPVNTWPGDYVANVSIGSGKNWVSRQEKVVVLSNNMFLNLLYRIGVL